ncbi:uncharacterized protein LOC120347289 [Styela clava]
MADIELQETPVLEQTTDTTVAASEENQQLTADQPPAESEVPADGTESGNDDAVNGNNEDQDQQQPTDGGDEEENNEDKRKLFVGGLSWETNQTTLKDFMQQFGDVEKTTVKMDSTTGRSRCFGFVIFKEVAGLEKALANVPHKVDDRTIDSKIAQPQRKEGKLFVGGVKPETTQETIEEYFSKFGKIEKYERPRDQKTDKPKPFCFITFVKDGPIAKITVDKYHDLDGKQVECKQAEPPSHGRDGSRGRGRNMGGRHMGGGSDWSGGFGNYGGPGGGYNQAYGPGGYGPGNFGYGGGFDPYGGYGNFNQGGYGYGGTGGYSFGGGGAAGGGYGFGGGQQQQQSGFGKTGRNRQGSNYKPY